MRDGCILIGPVHRNMRPLITSLLANGHRLTVITPDVERASTHPYFADAPRDSVSVLHCESLAPEHVLPRVASRTWQGTYCAWDAGQETQAHLRMASGLPATPPDVVTHILDKDRLKQTLRTSGLSHLDVVPHEEVEHLKTLPPGKWFFKPVRGGGSVGVSSVETVDDLRRAQDFLHTLRRQLEAHQLTPVYAAALESRYLSERYYLEQAFSGGELLTLDAMVIDGALHVLSLSKLVQLLHDREPKRMNGYVLPYSHPLEAHIVKRVAAALRLLGFRWGPVHVEVMVDAAEKRVEIIDLNARLIGGSMHFVHEGIGWDMGTFLADWALGRAPIRLPHSNTDGVVCLRMFLAPEGIDSLEALELPSPSDEVLRTFFLKAPGSDLRGNAHSIDWVGGILVKGETQERVLRRVNEIVETSVRINGKLPIYEAVPSNALLTAQRA